MYQLRQLARPLIRQGHNRPYQLFYNQDMCQTHAREPGTRLGYYKHNITRLVAIVVFMLSAFFAKIKFVDKDGISTSKDQ
jgi:hypothetical protein